MKLKLNLLSHLKNLKFSTVRESFLYYIKGLYHNADRHSIFLLSGGLSFSMFTCILPMLLIVFSLIGVLLARPGVLNHVQNFIDTIIPYSNTADEIKVVILDRINEFRIFKTISGSIGIIGLFFAASGLFSSMRTILNTVYGIKDTSNIVVNKLKDFVLIIVVVFFFLASMAIFPALTIGIHVLTNLSIPHIAFIHKFISTFVSYGLSGLSFVVIFLMLFLIYYLIPFRRLPIKVVWLSAFWAAFLWVVAKELFGYYITHSILLTRVYGTYVFIVVLALWVYYSSFVFILGAEIGNLYRLRKYKNEQE
jgi:membrane protein